MESHLCTCALEHHVSRNLKAGNSGRFENVLMLDKICTPFLVISGIYRKSESWPTMQLRSKFGQTVRQSVKDSKLRPSADYLANGTYPEAVNFYATLQVNRELAKASSVWV